MNDEDLKKTGEEIIKLGEKILSWMTKIPIDIRKPFDGDFKVTQRFGENIGIYKKWGYAGHFGIDWATPWGTPLKACDSGIVIRSGFGEGNGNFIEIKHSWGSSLVCHMANKPLAQVGVNLSKGEDIGVAGNTGYVIPLPTKENPKAGTHTHFSIKINGITNPEYKDFVDPMKYLS